MRNLLTTALAVAALAAGITFATASPAVAQVNDAADCAQRFGFAQNPVPVAKTADGQQVLASVRWGYTTGLCYLILDDAAVQTLRANPPTQIPQATTSADRAAANRCHNAHRPAHGFAQNPVPVAKTADGQQVLASVRWGYTTGLCYLTLDDAAVQTLRAGSQTAPATNPLAIPANPPSRISAGTFHFCYLRPDHVAVCPNANRFHGQALTGAPDGQFAAISSGYRHSCGLRNDGTVACWGDDQFGPYLAPGGQFVEVSAGSSYSCGLRSSGTIECWGHRNDRRDPIPANDVRLQAPAGQFAAVSASGAFACGLRTDRTVSCWGNNDHGRASPPRDRFIAIATGSQHACGIQVDGTLKCWGATGPAWGESDPPDGRFTAIAIGSNHSCGLRANGTIECWGANQYGKANSPAGQFTEVAAGGSTSCGLRPDQTAVCWGAIKRPFTGTVDVHVFYCASQSAAYSNADLQRETNALNDSVGTFFESQSSGLIDLNFVPGGVVSPNIEWDQHTVGDLFDGTLYGEPCETEIDKLGHYPQLLILVDLAPGSLDAFASIEGETVLAHSATLEARYSSSCSQLSPTTRVRDLDTSSTCSVYQRYYYAVGHEIGHTVFDLEHDLDCSIMSYLCVDDSRLGCTHLLYLGWPHKDQCEQDQMLREVAGKSYTSIQVGDRYYCGLRTDQTVNCWGVNNYGQTNAPSGTFTSLSVHYHHACGLRTDGTIACWGRNNHGQTNAPSGTFTSLSVHYHHACGLRTDGTIACWGRNNHGQTNAPSGTFTSVQTWRAHSCGVRTSGVTECWGDSTIGKAKDYSPGGQFTAVSAGRIHWCGLTDDQTIVCDGFFNSPATRPPAGNFIAVEAKWDFSCGLKADQTLLCWGDGAAEQFDPPSGKFTAISFAGYHACGLRTDQTIACWFHHADYQRVAPQLGQANPPAGKFTAVSSGHLHSCGLRADQTIACWGYDVYGQASPPAGKFTAVSAGGSSSCGLHTDQTIVCWGSNDAGHNNSPSGRFRAVSTSVSHACGLRTDQTIVCWGQSGSGQTDAPSGQFIAVATGGQHSCGIRANRTTVTCWGTVPE